MSESERVCLVDIAIQVEERRHDSPSSMDTEILQWVPLNSTLNAMGYIEIKSVKKYRCSDYRIVTIEPLEERYGYIKDWSDGTVAPMMRTQPYIAGGSAVCV